MAAQAKVTKKTKMRVRAKTGVEDDGDREQVTGDEETGGGSEGGDGECYAALLPPMQQVVLILTGDTARPSRVLFVLNEARDVSVTVLSWCSAGCLTSSMEGTLSSWRTAAKLLLGALRC